MRERILTPLRASTRGGSIPSPYCRGEQAFLRTRSIPRRLHEDSAGCPVSGAVACRIQVRYNKEDKRGGGKEHGGKRHDDGQVRSGGDAQGRRDHGRHHVGAGQDRRRGGRGRGDGAGARARGYPGGGRRGAHGRSGYHPANYGCREHPGDGQGQNRPFRRGADPRSLGRGLYRRERGPDPRR